jgi:hypothetical protein
MAKSQVLPARRAELLVFAASIAKQMIETQDLFRTAIGSITSAAERIIVKAEVVRLCDGKLLKSDGKPLSKDGITKKFDRYCSDLGIKWNRKAKSNKAKAEQDDADAKVGGDKAAVTGLSDKQKSAMILRAIAHVAAAQQTPPADLTAWLGAHLLILTVPTVGGKQDKSAKQPSAAKVVKSRKAANGATVQ